ncbi:MAG: 23S rRNA (guanosine(2251)-2'-O)-methyltransferase RlmB [Rhodospirillales bacterium RIFCSPLOWO2_12_FULL_67_15]|nr:MAG: 23S rRNA (guanosine(2251)-2'-O)-methyltransferase RlmB [Rhodospirillales bacterium RIFCSPLOWO2_12_FULL_67_15]
MSLNSDKRRRGRPHRGRPKGPEFRPKPTETRHFRPSWEGWLYGRHAVLAALANPARTCRRLVVSPEFLAQHQAAIGKALAAGGPSPPAPQTLPRSEIDRLLADGAAHQGIALLADPLPELAVEDICRRAAERARARVVVLDQATDPRNVGAAMRAAAAFAAEAVIIQDRHAPPAGGALAKAASGALERVALVRTVNLARALGLLKKAGFWCVGLDARAESTLGQTDLTGKIVLVLGAEGEGLRRLTRDSCDLLAKIPMAEGCDSLNLASAAAIALYEAFRPKPTPRDA